MYESHLRGSESDTERLVWVLPAQCAARLRVNGWLCARAVAQYPQAPDETKRPGKRKRSLLMAKYLLLRGGLVLLKTSTHCGMPIFSKVTTNWRAGSKKFGRPVRREGQSLLCPYPWLLAFFLFTAQPNVPPALACPSSVVQVNGTVPQVQPPKTALEFSANPTSEELFRARIFEEPL